MANKSPRTKRPVITKQDAYNTLQLFNRVQVTGINEAMVLGVLAQKFQAIAGDYKAPNGKDANPTD